MALLEFRLPADRERMKRERGRQQTDGGGGARARTASGGAVEWSCRSVCALVCDGSMATGLTKPEKVGGLDRILDGRTGKKEEVSDDVSTEHGLIPMSWSPSAHIYIHTSNNEWRLFFLSCKLFSKLPLISKKKTTTTSSYLRSKKKDIKSFLY
jgi:hypothetical protein